MDQNAVLEFIDAGHDMILAADSSASDLIRGIATECGVEFDEASCFCWFLPLFIHPFLPSLPFTLSQPLMFEWFQDPEAMVIDHINYASTEVEGDHTLIAGDDLIQSDVILGSKKIEVST